MKNLNDLSESGQLLPSKAPYGTLSVVPKGVWHAAHMREPSGAQQVDYENQVPILNVVEIFYRLGEARFFTKLNLCLGH